MQPTTGQDWFTWQGGRSNHRNASGTCLVRYERRSRQASRPFMSCHRTHSTYLSRTAQDFQYVLRPSVTQKRNSGCVHVRRATSPTMLHIFLLRNWSKHRGWVHKNFWQEMPGWVCIINCFSNLSMELLQLLTHHRNWRMHSNLSGTNCYPPFVSIGTSQRSIECSHSGFKVWPFLIPT